MLFSWTGPISAKDDKDVVQDILQTCLQNGIGFPFEVIVNTNQSNVDPTLEKFQEDVLQTLGKIG